jgi:hypothetical protein
MNSKRPNPAWGRCAHRLTACLAWPRPRPRWPRTARASRVLWCTNRVRSPCAACSRQRSCRWRAKQLGVEAAVALAPVDWGGRIGQVDGGGASLWKRGNGEVAEVDRGGSVRQRRGPCGGRRQPVGVPIGLRKRGEGEGWLNLKKDWAMVALTEEGEDGDVSVESQRGR